MPVVAERLSQVKLGTPQTYNNLAMFPVTAEGDIEPNYLLLDEALAQGYANVTEVSESGSVPELKFVNECDQPVFLLDGEELVGAKQNRILNLTVLAPANKTIVIPVSCVEAGRWRKDSEEFSSAKRAHFSRGRARKAANVTDSLRFCMSRSSNQSEVWADISEKAARMDVSSDTDAAAAMYETHQEHLDEYMDAFSIVDNQVGAMFAINGEVTGMDLFDCPSTMKGLLPKLVQSYALDAIEARNLEAKPGSGDAEKMLDDAAKAITERFPAVGEGDDIRLQGKRLSGGALVADAKVVHLCVFRMQEEDQSSAGNGGGRVARASLRRRGRI